MARPVMLTVSDVESMPDDGNRYEVIDGELFVSTAPSWFHQFALRKLMVAFDLYLQRNPIGEVAFGVGVIFDQFNGVIPDLVYLSHERLKTVGGERLSGAPEIVVEALSPGARNEMRDRTVKRHLYHENGVSEYWILDLEAKSVEIHVAGRTGGFQSKIVLHENDVITTALLPGFAFPVANLFPKQYPPKAR
jgi:Uma2 family endonuclease